MSRAEPRSAWVFTFNHALDDQQSVNNIVSDLFNLLDSTGSAAASSSSLPTLPSIESVIAPELPSFRTAKWSLYQLANMLSGAQLIPKHIKNHIAAAEDKKNTIYTNPNTRTTFTRRFVLDKKKFSQFRAACKKGGVSVTHALSALESTLTAALIEGVFRYDLFSVSSMPDSNSETKELLPLDTVKLRFLLSVSLRPFASPSYVSTVASDDQADSNKATSTAARDWASGSVACTAGALDYIVSVPGEIPQLIRKDPSQQDSTTLSTSVQKFWDLAKSCSETTDRLIYREKFVPESVRLFGVGMNIPGLDILKAVEVEASSTTSLGRGFSCGVSNAGSASFPTARLAGASADSDTPLSVEEVYFGTSHGRNGVLSLLSCLTVKEQLCGCLQFTSPLTSPQEADRLVDALFRIVSRVSE